MSSKKSLLLDNIPSSEFERLSIDVSIDWYLWILSCPIIHYGSLPYSSMLILEHEEAVKIDTNLCGKSVSRRPYGELGSVDKANCFCCVHASSNLGPISPGCGCNVEEVDKIVFELKRRMKGRGDTAQIRRTEEILSRFSVLEEKFKKISEVDEKLDLIIEHLKISKPVKSMEIVRFA